MKCNYCNSERQEVLHVFTNRKILKCCSCGLTFSEIGSSVLPSRYDSKYSDMIVNDFRLDMPHDDYAQRMLDKIEKFKKHGTILDIGSGAGYFLYKAKNRNWNTYGVELTDGNYQFERDRLGLKIEKKDIEQAELEKDFFDVVTMFDVIEHMKDPAMVLKKVFNSLKEGGILCIETPNIYSIYYRLIGRNWISFSEISHLYFLEQNTLSRILDKTGFKTIHTETDNVNFFSYEGLRRFRLHSQVYNLSLVINKIMRFHFQQRVREGKGSLQEKGALGRFKNKFIKAVNWPTNSMFNSLKLGDQLRVFAIKPKKE